MPETSLTDFHAYLTAPCIVNWLGQTIYVGDWVGCGRRDMNTTTVRLGSVIAIDEARKVVRVQWHYEPTYGWEREQGITPWRKIRYESKGSPNVDHLFLLDAATFGFDPFDQDPEDA